MGGNGEMHAQVVRVSPVLLSLYVNPRSWSQPFHIFPRQPRWRRAYSDHAPQYSITIYRKKLCRAPGLQEYIRRGRPEGAGGGIEEEGKGSRRGEAGSIRGEQGGEERKGRSERKGRCDEGIGC